MARFDYDVVFFRVFCVTLLVVAFTFTVILTNVFVDIDGLLSIKKKNTPENSHISQTFINEEDSQKGETNYFKFDEYKNHDSEINPLFRTKRSIESDSIINTKSPAMKKILSRRLANLLEEIDKEEEEAKKGVKLEISTGKEILEVPKDKEDASITRNEDLLHLALHNILLQGLIGHMDVNDVYKKVHTLVQTFDKSTENKTSTGEKLKILNAIFDSKAVLKESHDTNYNEEHKLFEELMKCKKLEKQIAKTTLLNEISTTSKNLIGKDDKIFIKTVIEINEDNTKTKGPNKTHLDENIEGVIKLIYNGKSIKISQMLNDSKSQENGDGKNFDLETVKNHSNKKFAESKTSELNHNINGHNTNPLLNTLEEYLKKLKIPNYEYLQSSGEMQNIKTQRLKRQIKIRYLNNVTKSLKTNSVHRQESKDDDDLYIEIETHFDGRGIKGEKKKKLVRNLIDKIQKALRSDIEKKHNSAEHIKFVKRIQDPIVKQNKILFPNKVLYLDPIEHRQLDPIGKSAGALENIVDRHGNTWKKQYNGPNFLSISKSVNSAEMNELNIDYDRVIRKNGFSKRLLKPLNTETDDSTGLLDSNSNNVSFFLKNIAGSGFSIGFNQYKGEPPDKESMKMFNGIENLIREYHRTYDQANNMSSESTINNEHNFVETGHEIEKRNVEKLHNIHRRSITQIGSNYYNSNIFRAFFKDNPSFDKYLNMFKRSNDKYSFNKNAVFYDPNDDTSVLFKNFSLKEVPVILDERILNKKLKPSEILTIANLDNRKRRSLNVKKISNLKSKIKLSRFLNTKTMANKKLFLMKKRNKRQVNNIKIVAKDGTKMPQKNSDENIFFISRENSYSDRETMIRTVETADTKINKYNQYYDEELPFDNIYKFQNPNIPTPLTEKVYSTALKSNKFMSQYPHIFLDKNSNSKEEAYFDHNQYQINDKPYRIEASPKPAFDNQDSKTTTEHNLAKVLQNLSMPKDEEMFGGIMPSLSGSNYKITVKMSPKNKTNTNARFKEIHTIVNKSFDENGFRYYTLLNMSQISKIETLNTTDNTKNVPSNDNNQQIQIKALLKLHKNNIDRQLNSLLTESNHLEKIIESNKIYKINKPMKLFTDDVNNLETANEENLRSIKSLDHTKSTEITYLTTMSLQSSEPAHTFTLPTTTELPKLDKSLIMDTIKRNEKVTFEILKKIDTNTEILQTFLQKFSNTLDLDKKERASVKTTENPALELKSNFSKDTKIRGENKDFLSVPREFKNATIPFVYAYQQSIPMNSKSAPQLWASLVYQGHIKPKQVQNTTKNNLNRPALQNGPKHFVNMDKTKIFNEPELLLNDLNNFKIISNKERVISANIKINTTKV